jgi:OOP family OmpA-OmpF porin
MNSTHAMRLVVAAGIGTLMTGATFGQDGSYYYGGLSVGQSLIELDQQRIAGALVGSAASATSIEKNERDTGYKLFGGWQFNRYLGAELGYFNLGHVGFTAHTTPTGTLDGSFRVHGFNLDLVGTVPFSDSFSGLVRVGGQYARTGANFNGTGAVTIAGDPNPTEKQWNPKFGVGLQYAVNRDFLVRAEVERYRVPDALGQHANVNMTSVSLVFPFGRAPMSAPRPVAMAPAYVAPVPEPVAMAAPAPAPIIVAVVTPPAPPVPPERRRVSFSAESLFGFDHSEVLPEGKLALDAFAKDLQGTTFDTINVEGHTDRLGSTAYNQTLSVQRAEAVKAYLVSAGVDGSKIAAVGKSESQPLTKAEDCKGNTPSPKLIACLQADRRVELEVVGTR